MKSLFSLIRALRLQAACAATLALGSCAVQALSVDDSRHLLTRTGFGAAPHPGLDWTRWTRTETPVLVRTSAASTPRWSRASSAWRPIHSPKPGSPRCGFSWPNA